MNDSPSDTPEARGGSPAAARAEKRTSSSTVVLIVILGAVGLTVAALAIGTVGWLLVSQTSVSTASAPTAEPFRPVEPAVPPADIFDDLEQGER